MPPMGGAGSPRRGGPQDPALRLLAERLARGDISIEEYTSRRAVLTAARPPAASRWGPGRRGTEVRVPCYGDAAGVALLVQRLPDSHHHRDRTTASVLRRGGQEGCRGTYLDTRGPADVPLAEGAHRGPTDTDWTVWAAKVISFCPSVSPAAGAAGGGPVARSASREV